MRKTTDFVRAIGALTLLAAGTLLTGCSSDDSIDMGEIDTNIGVGSDGFKLPSSSTNDIKLSDVLKLKEGDCIETLSKDSAGYKKGDYQFRKSDSVATARPKVKQVKFNKQTVNPEPLTVPVTSEMITAAIAGLSQDFAFPRDEQGNPSPGRVATFNFNNAGEAAVLSLTEADVKGGIDLNVKVTMLKEAIKKVSLDIYLPNFFKLNETGLNIVTDSKYPDYQILQLKNISTDQDLLLKLKVTQLRNFKTEIPTGSDNYMVVNPTIIQMAGMVKMLLTINTQDLKEMTPGTHNVGIDVDMGADFVATHAEGYFSPDIKLDPSTVDIGNDVPDFLNDEKVKINLSDPCIKLHVKNNIDVEGLVDAKMTATYKDGKKKRLMVPGIVMKAKSESEESTVIICRKAGSETGVQYITLNQPGEFPIAGSDTVEVKDLAAILNKIPEKIYFEFDANANSSKKGRIDLYDETTPETDYSAHGRGYMIKPDYSFVAPLTLDAGSTIVYNDTIDDWNKDLVDNDIELYEGTTVVVEANIKNGTPLKLKLDPTPINVDKKKINDVTVTLATNETGNIVSSGYGTDKVTKLTITLKSNHPTAFKKLDGLLFEVTADTDKPGITLNSESQTIKISDLKVNLTGKVIINLDKKKD